MKTSDVSVIIPTYNRAGFIIESIESVLDQTMKAKEIIVVDNGSTDSTAEVLKPLMKHITYLEKEPSGGPAAPRNMGIKHATGSLIAFQDSDDLWVPTKIADQVAVMEDADILLSYGNAGVVTGQGKDTGEMVLNLGDGKSGFIFKDLVATNFVSTLTVMTRREALLAVGGFNETPGLVEDWELWLRMSRLGRFQYIDKPLAMYRRHEGTISSALDDGTFNYILNVYKTILKQPLRADEQAVVRRGMSGALRARAAQRGGTGSVAPFSQAIMQRALAELLALQARVGVQKRHSR